MRHLLDINVLIALFDPDHAFHGRAHDWWGHVERPWASCPITENGLVRIMASTSYSRVTRFSISDVAGRLDHFVRGTDHEFWPDSVSLRDRSRMNVIRVLSTKHLTDVYLLALATVHDGCLVTFDHRIPIVAIPGASSERMIVL